MRTISTLLACAAALLALSATATAATFSPVAGSPSATRSTDTTDLAMADFDLDGRLDAVVADRGAGELAVLRGSTGGGFGAVEATPIASPGPVRVQAADLDGDGFPDAIVQRQNQSDVTVLRGDGTGALTPVAGSPFPAAGEIWSMDVADVNGDGVQDVVAALLDGRVQPLLGTGGGRLSAGAVVDVGGGMLPIVATGRFDADRRVDVVLASRTAATVTVLRGGGDGTFAPAPGGPLPVGAEPSALVAEDFDRDGDLDVATSNQSDGTVTIALGDGTGRLAVSSTVAATLTPTDLAVGDVDRDGDLDLAVARYVASRVQLLVNAGDGTFSTDPDPQTTVAADPIALTAGDLDGDGLADLQVLGRGLVASLRNESVAAVVVDQPALGFADQAVGTLGGGQTVTVTSTGSLRLNVERLRVDGTAGEDFLLLQDTCGGRSLVRGASCSVRVRFAPTADGPRAATLVVESDAAGPAPTVALSGAGIASPPPADGSDGAAGRDGVAGRDGANGRDGAAGPSGAAGPAGPSGTAGPTGPQGRPGPPAATAPAVACTRAGARAVRCSVTLRGALAGRRGVVAVRLLRGRAQAAATRGRARGGRVTVTLRSQRALRRGRYQLVVAASARRGAPVSRTWVTIR